MARGDHFRAHSRLRVDLRARVHDEEGGWLGEAKIVDLGLGGACLELAVELERDAPLQLALVAPTLWDPLPMAARVAWSAPASDASRSTHRTGLRFEHADPATVVAIAELIGAHAYGT